MNRSISSALILSIGLHAALVYVLLAYRSDPPLAGDRTVVNVTFRGSVEQAVLEGDSGDEARVEDPTDSSAESLMKDRESDQSTNVAPVPPAEIPPPTRVPVAADDRRPVVDGSGAVRDSTEGRDSGKEILPTEPMPSVGELPNDSSSPDAEHAVEPTVAHADLITTKVPTDIATVAPSQSAPVAAPKMAMSAEQRIMVNEKAAEWMRALNSEGSLDSSVEWEHEGRAFHAQVSAVAANSDTGLDRMLIEISTQLNGERVATRMSMKRLAFSSYAQFVDRWDPSVQIHDDVIDGRFHSNSEIRVNYSGGIRPTFLGRVTTVSRRVNTSNSRGRVDRGEMFLGGLETGVRRIALPKDFSPIPDDSQYDDDQIHRFEQDARITFYADGTYGWVYVGSGEPEQKRKIIDGGSYLVAASKSELFLKGVVRGAVLVYSPDRISIEGELRYARDPILDPDSDDFLGLVADKSVEIAGPKVTGLGDLRVDASIYARRRFVVTSYRTRNDGTLHLYGSLAAGSISATEPRFATMIQFDPRLEDARPPAFPMTDRYELEPWSRSWEIEPFMGDESSSAE